MQTFTFLIGLPGSGKSTWIEENKGTSWIVSSDKIKEKAYSVSENNTKTFNEFCEDYHEKSVEIAEAKVYAFIRTGVDVILDGCGTDSDYNLRIINHIRFINPDIKIKAIYFDVPIETCLERMKSRERQVPIDEVYKKSQLLPEVLDQYKFENISITIIL